MASPTVIFRGWKHSQLSIVIEAQQYLWSACRTASFYKVLCIYKGLGITQCLCFRTAQDLCKKGWDEADSRAPHFLSFLRSIKNATPTVIISKLSGQVKINSCTSFNKTLSPSF